MKPTVAMLTLRARCAVPAALVSLLIVACVGPPRTHVPETSIDAAPPESRELGIPAQVLGGYDPSSRLLRLSGREGEQATLRVPEHFTLRSIPDSEVDASFFYYAVNASLWGVPQTSYPVATDRIQAIRTIKIDLQTVSGVRAVAGFILFTARAGL